jgi:hypothetical protein
MGGDLKVLVQARGVDGGALLRLELLTSEAERSR